MMSHAMEHNHTWENFSNYGYPNIKFSSFNNQGGYAYIFFKNETQDITMQSTIELLGS